MAKQHEHIKRKRNRKITTTKTKRKDQKNQAFARALLPGGKGSEREKGRWMLGAEVQWAAAA